MAIRKANVEAPTLIDRLRSYAFPGILMTFALYYFLVATLSTLLTSPRTLLSLPTLRHKAFARLWLACGAAMSLEMPAPLPPLLQSLRGTVLDVGPGSGEQLRFFAPAAAEIDTVWAVEPAKDLHEGLRRKAAEAGMRRYEVLGCGAEVEELIPALAKAGLLGEAKGGEGIFDAIVCIRVLCGVPRLEETVRGLYGLLKPGGQMIVCEHVVNPARNEKGAGSLISRMLQTLYMFLGWSFLLGGCCLDRDTGKVLRGVGEWEKVDLEYVDSWGVVPYIVGHLVKRT